jgi:hypothetical protein
LRNLSPETGRRVKLGTSDDPQGGRLLPTRSVATGVIGVHSS